MLLNPKTYRVTEDFGLLFSRLILAAVFIPAGLGKLENLERPIQFFEQLGIPFAEIQAPMVAGLELGCGVLLLLGVLSRFAAIPLIVIMVVAILTAKLGDISGIGDLMALSEFLYIALLFLIVGFGSGRISLDEAIFNSGHHQEQNYIQRPA